MRQIPKDSTDISVELYIVDSTTGAPELGVLWNTAGIDLNYRRDGAVVTSITEKALGGPALTDAHDAGGFLEVANGRYRFDVPDAAFATGVSQVTIGGTVTGMVVLPITIQLVDVEAFAGAYAGPRGPGVYYNDAAGNTDTVDGTDGTWFNPVSTIAAAKTIADSLNIQRIYFVNNSDATLAATMEGFELVGIGEMTSNTVNFGTQDVDNTTFFNMLLTGAQGGTGRCQAEGCCLSVITGMEITALRCLIANAGSLTLRDDCAFDACFSAVAGGNTPTLDINSVANVNVYFRHYSGGLQVDNAVATTVMSYESDGQIIIDASCTSLTVHVRGNCSINDNGTTTDLTRDAAISRTGLFGGDYALSTTGAGRIDVGLWIGTAVTLSSTTTLPEVDTASVSDDATAANNLETAFDGGSYNVGGGGTVVSSVTTKTGYSLTADQSGVTIGTTTVVTNAVVTDGASRTASKANVSALATTSDISDAHSNTDTLIGNLNNFDGTGATLTAGERIASADALLIRDIANVEDTMAKHSLGARVLVPASNFQIAGSTITALKASDDSLTSLTYTFTTDADADPITGVT